MPERDDARIDRPLDLDKSVDEIIAKESGHYRANTNEEGNSAIQRLIEKSSRYLVGGVIQSRSLTSLSLLSCQDC